VKSLSPLQIALGVSVAVHAVLLTVRFVDPEGFNRVFQDTPLEVILVNARTNERPDKAQAIAQASLAGGGEAEKGRATSPLPPSAMTELGDAAEDSQKKIESVLQEQQMMLLTQLKRQLAAMPPPDLKQPTADPESAAREDQRRLLLKTLAEIEKRINEENARPRKRYISPSTREEFYAVYYDGLRRKIEDRGTRNFPQHGGRKIYGRLVMQVAINFEGHVVETVVEHTSGNLVLDRRAQQIAQSAGPFGKVPSAVKNKLLNSGFNRLAFVATFNFATDGQLETTLKSR
jgi:protein TonB